MKDLIVLVADLDAEQGLRGLYSRPAALGTRVFTFDIFRHPRRDPGCLHEANDFLRGFIGVYERAILLFDHEGCGCENTDVAALENTLRSSLDRSGWGQNAEVIILQPELEIWVWSDSPHVDAVLGWAGHMPQLRDWLRSQNWLNDRATKPARPKESMHAALKVVKKVPSASIFFELATRISVRRCEDAAFRRMVGKLCAWFPEE